MFNHFKIANKAEQPAMSRHFSDTEEFFNRPIDEYNQWILDINAEALDMIILDLLKLSVNKPVVAYGYFDARLIKRITTYNKAVFLYAEEELIRRDYYAREDKKPILDAINKLKKPEKVIKHTLDLTVNISNGTIEKTMKALEKHFKLI